MTFATVYTVCMRCGPHIKECERARAGKRCPVRKTTTKTKETYDILVEQWYEKLRKSRAANFPAVFVKKEK